MNATALLSFLAGILTVIYLEIQGLEALLSPIRGFLEAVFSGI